MALEGVLPVADVIRTRSLRSSSVVVVIKGGLLVSSDVFNQIIGRLISNVRILLQEDGILADFISNLVLGILRVLNTEGNISVKSTCGWGFGVAVAMVGGGWVMQRGVSMMGWSMMNGVGVGGKSNREGHKNGSNLKNKFLCTKIRRELMIEFQLTILATILTNK